MISVEKLTFIRDGKTLLREISFSVRPGERVALLGHNGSGKTTLLKHLNGLLLPTKGNVSVDGHPTSPSSSGEAVRKLVGMVFQNPEDQIVYSTVEEDLAFGLENLGVAPPEMRRRISRVLGQLGITQLRTRDVQTLSFGQLQLTALAGVLVMEPRYLLFDEPTTMLDAPHKRRFWDALGKICAGKGVLFSTNDLRDLSHASRALILQEGRLIYDGSASVPKRILKKGGLLD